LFTIDKSKCVNCGICAADCPVKIIRMDEGQKCPVPAEKAQELCINCGHCVAACPEGAFSLETMPVEKCWELPESWKISRRQTEDLLKGRRSIRVYKKDKADKADLEKIIDICRYAPSGINLQPVRWLVVYDSAKVRELAGLTIEMARQMVKDNSPMAQFLHLDGLVSAWDNGEDRICRGAPHLVIAYALKDDATAPAAATIALAYFELAALSFGLGTCWGGYLNMALNTYEPARAALGISKRCVFHGALMAGFPEFQHRRIPLRNDPHIKWK